MTRQRRYQLRQAAAGRCQICGKPAGEYRGYCPRHAAANVRHQAAHRARKGER
jgi:hypothetical protein